MKSKKCDTFNVISTSVNSKIVKRYETFQDKLNYFYEQGGTSVDLINCVYQINHGLLKDMANNMKENANQYKEQVDSFGFSALYYYNLRYISVSIKLELEEHGFKEIYPSYYSVKHFDYYSYYSHNAADKSTAFVFLGEDKTGALDVNVVHTFFMKGYNVISIDARDYNIQLKEVYNIVYQHSDEDISLFYIGSHGAKSTLRNNMHVLPILGYDEKVKETIGNVATTYYIENSINTAIFIRGISYAASGYNSWMTSFLASTPWFFPAGKEISIFLASCNGQLVSFDIKHVLSQGSQILILGENQHIKGVHHVHHVTNQDEINLLDSISRNDRLTKIDLKNLMDAYTSPAEGHGVGAPYYLKILGHKLWGTPITKEFSCLTVLQEKTAEIIKMRQEKNYEYIELLAYVCNYGYSQTEPILEDTWTKEYIQKVTIMIQWDVENAKTFFYGNVAYYGVIFYEKAKETFNCFCEEVNYYGNEVYDYILGKNQEKKDGDSNIEL